MPTVVSLVGKLPRNNIRTVSQRLACFKIVSKRVKVRLIALSETELSDWKKESSGVVHFNTAKSNPRSNLAECQ
jgi:hypothetical protein